jgi:fatty acid/phospholipid biosynthesis enzyme
MYMATIALDAMGGDFGPEVVIPAAVHVVKKIQRCSHYSGG